MRYPNDVSTTDTAFRGGGGDEVLSNECVVSYDANRGGADYSTVFAAGMTQISHHGLIALTGTIAVDLTETQSPSSSYVLEAPITYRASIHGSARF